MCKHVSVQRADRLATLTTTDTEAYYLSGSETEDVVSHLQSKAIVEKWRVLEKKNRSRQNERKSRNPRTTREEKSKTEIERDRREIRYRGH